MLLILKICIKLEKKSFAMGQRGYQILLFLIALWTGENYYRGRTIV